MCKSFSSGWTTYLFGLLVCSTCVCGSFSVPSHELDKYTDGLVVLEWKLKGGRETTSGLPLANSAGEGTYALLPLYHIQGSPFTVNAYYISSDLIGGGQSQSDKTAFALGHSPNDKRRFRDLRYFLPFSLSAASVIIGSSHLSWTGRLESLDSRQSKGIV